MKKERKQGRVKLARKVAPVGGKVCRRSRFGREREKERKSIFRESFRKGSSGTIVEVYSSVCGERRRRKQKRFNGELRDSLTK